MHITHRHDIPAALDVLCNHYLTKIADLEEEKLETMEKLNKRGEGLLQANRTLCEEMVARTNDVAQLRQRSDHLGKAKLHPMLRDMPIKNRLGIELKNPFESPADSKPT